MNVFMATESDIDKIYEMVMSVTLDRRTFIKSSREEIRGKIEKTRICIKDGKMVGVMIVDVRYIDTIVSKQEGAGTALLSSLVGRFYTNISKENKRSIGLFSKLGFSKVGEEIVCGEERLRYEASL